MIGGKNMDNKKESTTKSIVINLISNTIFQIFLLLVSGSGGVYTVRRIINSLKNSQIEISIFSLIITLMVFCIVMFITVFSLFRKINKYKQVKDEKKEFNDVEDYYFINYVKHLTIYKDGTGIIIHSFTVVINNIHNFKRIRRKLNIEDGNIYSHFPSIEDMMKTSKSDRFDKFGFWYYSRDNIISEVKEFYWQKNSSEENKKIKANPKEIRWVFKIDKQRINENVPYDISYVISVPGLAPIENGRLNCNLRQEEFGDICSSNMNIDHKIRNLKYIISFEKEVELETIPECRYIIGEQDESSELKIEGECENSILYDKYIFNINNPKFNSDIKVTWKYNKVNYI